LNYVNNLQVFREKLNVSRAELARLTGLSTSGIYRIETGSREPKISNALAISEALKYLLIICFHEIINTQHNKTLTGP